MFFETSDTDHSGTIVTMSWRAAARMNRRYPVSSTTKDTGMVLKFEVFRSFSDSLVFRGGMMCICFICLSFSVFIQYFKRF